MLLVLALLQVSFYSILFYLIECVCLLCACERERLLSISPRETHIYVPLHTHSSLSFYFVFSYTTLYIGDILLLNLKLDIVLFSFQQSGGSVTSLSFRIDSAIDTYPYLASSSNDGTIHVWNLGTGNRGKKSSDDSDDEDNIDTHSQYQKTRKLAFSIDEAHSASVGRLHFLHAEPVMITVAADNSLKMWIFDSPDGLHFISIL